MNSVIEQLLRGLTSVEIKKEIALLEQEQRRVGEKIALLHGLLAWREEIEETGSQRADKPPKSITLREDAAAEYFKQAARNFTRGTSGLRGLRGGAAVLYAMQSAPENHWRANDVATELERHGVRMKLPAIRVAMGRLVEAGDLIRVGKGTYALKLPVEGQRSSVKQQVLGGDHHP